MIYVAPMQDVLRPRPFSDFASSLDAQYGYAGLAPRPAVNANADSGSYPSGGGTNSSALTTPPIRSEKEQPGRQNTTSGTFSGPSSMAALSEPSNTGAAPPASEEAPPGYAE
ncbi:hypothetical protein C8R44DRAFT_824408 [Mycena epipterygia]|nr:hypothetical protein C8R44DRAFT_824408 [Mycena epipterygia]